MLRNTLVCELAFTFRSDIQNKSLRQNKVKQTSCAFFVSLLGIEDILHSTSTLSAEEVCMLHVMKTHSIQIKINIGYPPFMSLCTFLLYE